jgi:lysophospholipase L1-like esterase
MSFITRVLAVAVKSSFAAATTLLAACGSPPTTPSNPGPVAPETPAKSDAPAEPAPAPAPAPPPASAAGGPSATPDASAKTAPPPAAEAGEPFPKGAKILIIGDSFAQSLGVGLKTREGDLGVKFVLQGEQSTYIPEWAGAKRDVPGLLRQFKPDLVVISLGGNELAMSDPSVRAPRVKELVGHMKGTIPCVWVAPALWGNKETGLLQVIKDNSSPCRHFDSNKLTPDLPRGGDKIHPNPEGQKKWANALIEWVRTERDRSKEGFALKPRPPGE